MPSPTERIVITQLENAKIRAGLDKLVNGIAEVVLNKRPSPDLTFPFVSDKFQPREFSNQLYQAFLVVTARLLDVRHHASCKLRLNHLDLLIAAFSIRVSRGRKGGGAATMKLEAKLEKYRKRIKGRNLSSLGVDVYNDSMAQWKSFRNWIRFNVLPLRTPWRPFRQQIFWNQSEILTTIARRAITDICANSLPEDKLQHLLTLAISELRRGRHAGLTVRGLIASPGAARDFLFTFIRKRSPELREKKMIRTQAMHDSLRISTPEHVELETISEEKVKKRIARFFREKIPPADWESVKDQVEFLADRSEVALPALKAMSLDEVFRETEPTSQPADLPGLREHAAEWLLLALAALNAHGPRASNLVRGGWALARAAS
jgi:hypothetical protein